MENTLQNAPASPSVSAEPAWFTNMVAPASADPVVEPAPPSPEDSGGPEPVVTEPATEQPVTSEAEAPTPEPTPEPQVDEVAELRARLAEIEQQRAQEKQERDRAEREAQTLRNREEYWAEARKHAAAIDDDEERAEYFRKAAETLVDQEARAVQEQAQIAQFTQAIRNFPSYAQQHHGITADQAAVLTEYASDPNPQTAALKVSTALDIFMKENAAIKPTVSPEATRAAVEQSLAQRASAEAATSGVTATGGINGANPAPSEKPTSLRPGSPESLAHLARALGLSQ